MMMAIIVTSAASPLAYAAWNPDRVLSDLGDPDDRVVRKAILELLDTARGVERCIDSLAALLYHEDRFLRRYAILSMAPLRPGAAVDALIHILEDPRADQNEKDEALRLLASFGSKAENAVACLVQQVVAVIDNGPEDWHGNLAYAQQAIMALKIIGPAGVEALESDVVPYLAKILNSGCLASKAQSVALLGYTIGPAASAAGGTLASAFGPDDRGRVVLDGVWCDGSLRAGAYEAIGWIGHADAKVFDRLVRAAFSPQELLDVRLAATRAISKIQGQADAARNALLEMICRKPDTADDGEVRREAVVALSRLGCLAAEEAIPSLWKMLRGVDPGDVEFASWALGVLDTRDVSQIIAELRSPSYDKRRAAAAVLGELAWGASDAVPELTRALWDTGSYRLRSLAARALGMVGARAQSALPTLQKTCRSDAYDEVREAAAAAIAAIQSPAFPAPVTTNMGTITLEELERGILEGSHVLSTDFALTLKAMGRPIVPLLDYILRREGDGDYDRHGTSAYPFNVLYALSHIGGQPALTTLRRFCALVGAGHYAQDMPNAVLARWTNPHAGVLVGGGAVDMAFWDSAYVSGITAGEVVDIICPNVLGLDIEEGSVGRWAFVQAASGERGYIIAEAMTDSLTPWY